MKEVILKEINDFFFNKRNIEVLEGSIYGLTYKVLMELNIHLLTKGFILETYFEDIEGKISAKLLVQRKGNDKAVFLVSRDTEVNDNEHEISC